MTKGRWYGLAFLFMCLVQWYVPSKMIIDKDASVREGTKFKFKVIPVDPNDPFRGKYVALNFALNSITVPDSFSYSDAGICYALLDEDDQGYAFITQLKPDLPTSSNYIKVNITSSQKNDSAQIVHFDLPFDRFYMEESKAPEAERKYREAVQDGKKEAWAEVFVHSGDAVLWDVLLEGVSLRDL